MSERLSFTAVVEEMHRKHTPIPEIVEKMLGQGFYLLEIGWGFSAIGHKIDFSRDEENRLSTLFISDKPIQHMLMDLVNAASDAVRDRRSYPRDVALGDFWNEIDFVIKNRGEIDHPTGYCITRYEVYPNQG